MKSGIFDSVPSNKTSVYVYTCEEDGHGFSLPVAAGAATSAYKTTLAGGSFDKITLTAVPTNYSDADENPNLVFTLNSKDSIWTRLTYNGTASEWKQIKLDENRGTYDAETSTPSTVAVALHTGVTMNIGNYVLTAATDAKRGKVPGRCETQFNIELNLDTIATLDGGVIKFEYAIQATQPTGTVSAMSLFLTQYKTPTIASVSAEYVTKKQQTVSGLTYNISGSTAKISTGTITNSQWKSAPNQNRLTIDAAGNPTTYTISQLTATGGVTTSAATYSLAETTLTLGTSGSGTATITATPLSHASGTAKTTSLSNWWGSIPTSTALKENFGKESGTGGYRMKTPTSTSVDFVSTEDVTTHSIDVNGTTCCSAVCQFGKLLHPASAVADANGKDYKTTTSPACFIRTFTGSKPNKFTLSGINLIQSDKVQIWWKDGGNWYDLSTPVTGSVAHTNAADGKADTITKTILTADGETSRPDMLIAIVVQPSASYIGPITATFA